MINQVYQLVGPYTIKTSFETIDLSGDGILVRPTRLSICAADQRYFTGTRGKEAMKQKLPMALIHEGAGVVVYDPKNEFKEGDKVILVPNTPVIEKEHIAENYVMENKFRASGFDGYMQDHVLMDRDRVLPYDGLNEDIASFIELVSVAIHSITRFERKSIPVRDTIGVWGDGNLGFILAILLRNIYPNSKLVVFGKDDDKLNFFTFVDETYNVDEVPQSIRVDHAFEAVGGRGSEAAVHQIIDHINPEGTIALLGVSETPIEINTRMVLERGLLLIGSSRSGREDFVRAIELLQHNEEAQGHLAKLISSVIEVNSVADMKKAFEYDLTTPFKTIMKWNI